MIDADGIVHWSSVSPVGINPGADGILSALEDDDLRRYAEELGLEMSGVRSGVNGTPTFFINGQRRAAANA